MAYLDENGLTLPDDWAPHDSPPAQNGPGVPGPGSMAAKAAMVGPTPPPGGVPAGMFTFGQQAPQSMQPYGPFSFDPSKVGSSDAFRFRFDKAMQAIQRLGTARGTYFNPQMWKAMQDEASGLASQEYDAEYGRQANTYGMNFGTHGWNEESRYNSQRSNRLDDFGIMDTDRRFNRGLFESDRAFDYNRDRDEKDDLWRFTDYGAGASRYAR